jgi:hypothetical protein
MLQLALVLAFRSPRYVTKDASASNAFSMGSTSGFHPRSRIVDIDFAVSSASGSEEGAQSCQQGSAWPNLKATLLTESDDAFLYFEIVFQTYCKFPDISQQEFFFQETIL